MLINNSLRKYILDNAKKELYINYVVYFIVKYLPEAVNLNINKRVGLKYVEKNCFVAGFRLQPFCTIE
jgi:hypothetical protein